MNSQPDHAQIPPNPGAIHISDVFSMYIALTAITLPPTEARTKAITNLETLILNFTQQLGIPGVKN